MNTDTDFETDLRGHLHDATDGLHAPVGFWADVAHRGRRRLRRRRMAAGASAAVTVIAVVAGVAMLVPPPAVPTIEPATPGDTTDEEAAQTEQTETDAEAEARAEARAEVEAQRAEADAMRLQAEREAAEARAQMLDRLSQEEPVSPITGYGDYSDIDFFELDSYTSTELIVRCILDAGFDVELAPPGDGILYNEPDLERNRLAAATGDACRAGLNLPDVQPATREQLEIVYAYHLAVHKCLVDQGLEVPPPASLQRFLSDEGWHPYADVPDALDDSAAWTNPMDDWDEIQMRCPQQPVGGFGTWAPGDPVRSVESLPDLGR